VRPEGFPTNALNWAIVPESLYWGPKFLYERYGKPIVISENGICNLDWPSLDGQVHDPQRIDFMHRYLNNLKCAISEKIPVQGYFHWSLTDNFEWSEGFNRRFGLVYIDYSNQKRILKDSAHWYANVIKTNGNIL
jgi:beta-glucosidase